MWDLPAGGAHNVIIHIPLMRIPKLLNFRLSFSFGYKTLPVISVTLVFIHVNSYTQIRKKNCPIYVN